MNKHKRRAGKKCDWCNENANCVAALEQALRLAPTAYELTIQLVIDALKAENRGCR